MIISLQLYKVVLSDELSESHCGYHDYQLPKNPPCGFYPESG